MQTQEQIETIHLSDYFRVILKHKILIAAILACVVVVVMFQTFRMPPIYKAHSQLAIDREKTSSPLTGSRTDYVSYLDQQLTFNTHFELIKSKPVIIEVIRDLKLDQPGSQDIDEALSLVARVKKKIKYNLSILKNNFKRIIGKEQDKKTDEEKLDSRVRSIQGVISVKQIPDTRLVTISVVNSNPDMAARIANSVAEKYVEFDMGSRLSSSKNSIEWMNNEMYRLKKRLEDDEQKFLEYKQLNKLFSVEGKQKVISQKIQEFNNEYLRARNKRLELDAQLQQIDELTNNATKDFASVRSIINNPAVDAIYKNITDLELERERLSKVFRAKHPKMVQNGGEIEKNKLKLQSELEKEVGNLRTERSVMLAKERVMEQNIAEFEKDALEESGKELKYTILQRNLETSQNLYDTLVAKVKESGVLSSSDSSNIRIVEEAITPVSPIGPNKKKNFLIAMAIGLFGGIGLAFLLEYLDQSLKSEEEVADYLGLPVLSVIPVAEKN